MQFFFHRPLGGCKRSRWITQLRVFFRMSMRGVSVDFTFAWLVWWRQKDLLKGNFDGETQGWEFSLLIAQRKIALPSRGARSRSIGRGRAVAKCKQWKYCCVLDEEWRGLSQLDRVLARKLRALACWADKHTHDVVLPCTRSCSREAQRSSLDEDEFLANWRKCGKVASNANERNQFLSKA